MFFRSFTEDHLDIIKVLIRRAWKTIFAPGTNTSFSPGLWTDRRTSTSSGEDMMIKRVNFFILSLVLLANPIYGEEAFTLEDESEGELILSFVSPDYDLQNNTEGTFAIIYEGVSDIDYEDVGQAALPWFHCLVRLPNAKDVSDYSAISSEECLYQGVDIEIIEPPRPSIDSGNDDIRDPIDIDVSVESYRVEIGEPVAWQGYSIRHHVA